MPQKGRTQVDRHPPKDGENWLWPEQQQLLYRFLNDLAAQHAKW